MQTIYADSGLIATASERRLSRSTVGAVAALLLSGCGGGGAGGGGTAPTPFTSYGSIVYPSIVKMSGSSQEATYTYGTGTGKFTSLTTPSLFTSGASITDSWDASHALTDEVVRSYFGSTLLALSAANGDILAQTISGTNIVYGKSANGQNYLLEADHANASLAWNYQNFGVWLTGAGTGFGYVGAITAGAETSSVSVPVTGSYTFTGVAAGYYVDTTGAGSFVTSSMNAAVNFSSRSITFSTTGSAMTSNLSVAPVANSNLNMTGTLSYAGGFNQFSGTVTTVGGGTAGASMSGTATGKFYGPSAQEMGGTFSVSSGTVGSGGAAYIGGFGAKR